MDFKIYILWTPWPTFLHSLTDALLLTHFHSEARFLVCWCVFAWPGLPAGLLSPTSNNKLVAKEGPSRWSFTKMTHFLSRASSQQGKEVAFHAEPPSSCFSTGKAFQVVTDAQATRNLATSFPQSYNTRTNLISSLVLIGTDRVRFITCTRQETITQWKSEKWFVI